MSILSNIWDSITSLIAPQTCAACGKPLTPGQTFVCTLCRATLPSTNYENMSDNPMAERLRDLCPYVEQATAHLFYIHKSGWQRVIHKIKYYNGWRDAQKMGEWYGLLLSRTTLYADIDVVVPVPLHPLKRLKRGYNQCDYIARGVAKSLGCATDLRALKRLRNNPSQTQNTTQERWDNVEALFAVRHPQSFDGKHVLLVDDVFTTGATVVACCEAIHREVPSARIFVATLAVSYRQFGFDR